MQRILKLRVESRYRFMNVSRDFIKVWLGACRSILEMCITVDLCYYPSGTNRSESVGTVSNICGALKM